MMWRLQIRWWQFQCHHRHTTEHKAICFDMPGGYVSSSSCDDCGKEFD